MSERKNARFALPAFAKAGGAVCRDFRVGTGPEGSFLTRRSGSKVIHVFDAPVRGALSALDGVRETLYVFAGRTLWLLDPAGDGELTDDGSFHMTALGTAADGFPAEGQVELFRFAGKVYVLGGGYLCYDGTTLAPVEGYAPLIWRNGDSSFTGGNAFEPENLLTAKVRARFRTAVGSSVYYLKGGAVASVGKVTVDGAVVPETAYRFQNGAHPRIVVDDASLLTAAEDDNLEILYTLDRPAAVRETLLSCTHAAVYGGDAETRVFLYGGSDRPAVFASMTENHDALPNLSAEYFPAPLRLTVGDGSLPVTAAVRQFDRLVIFTAEGAFYTYPESETLVNGVPIMRFPILPLNAEVGALASSGAALCENEPYALNALGLYRYKATTVRDERLAVRIEAPAALGLTGDLIRSCRLWTNRPRGELWCVTSDAALVWNARVKTWYRFTLPCVDFCFSLGEDGGFAAGELLGRFTGEVSDDLGEDFTSVWESAPLDFGLPFDRKELYRLRLLAGRGSEVTVVLTTDRGDSETFLFAPSGGTGADDSQPALCVSHASLSGFTSLKVRIEADGEALVRGVELEYAALERK